MKNPDLFSVKNEKPLQEAKEKRKFRSHVNVENVEALNDEDLGTVSGGLTRPLCCVTPI